MQFRIPVPPSVNVLHYNKAADGRGRTEAYDAWRRTAGWELKLQRARPVPTPVKIRILVPRNPKRDADSHIKAVQDLLVMMNVLPDDRMEFVEEVACAWHDLDHGDAVVDLETVTPPLTRSVASQQT